MVVIVLDTGAVSRVLPSSDSGRARLRALVGRSDRPDLVLPAAVLAEGLFTGQAGHDYHVRQLLSVVRVVDIDQSLGLAAGRLRREALAFGARPSGVDAMVVAVADQLAAVQSVEIFTTDPDDLTYLAVFAEHVERISVGDA